MIGLGFFFALTAAGLLYAFSAPFGGSGIGRGLRRAGTAIGATGFGLILVAAGAEAAADELRRAGIPPAFGCVVAGLAVSFGALGLLRLASWNEVEKPDDESNRNPKTVAPDQTDPTASTERWWGAD